MGRPAFDLLLWTSTAFDVAVALAALLVASRGAGAGFHLSVGRVLGAFALTVAVIAVKLAVLVELGVLDAHFGVVHLLFLDAVVTLPVAAAATLLAARRRGGRTSRPRVSRPVVVLALLGCLAAPVGAYASFVEPFALRVERDGVPLRGERQGGETIQVGVLADIQTDDVGSHERRAVERVMRARPDLILLPGDLFQGGDERFERELPELRALLRRLSAPGGVFFVQGDADRDIDRVERAVAGSRVRILRNEVILTRVRDRRVAVAGVDLEWRSSAAQRAMRRLGGSATGDVRLLLAHRPDAAMSRGARRGIDLVVAGHTHGGQLQVPGYGPPVTASRVPRRVGGGGLHRIRGGPRVYVSRGVGVERGQAPRMRFLAPPEVSLLALGEDGAVAAPPDRD